jgi:hypothetical protein
VSVAGKSESRRDRDLFEAPVAVPSVKSQAGS